jgi:hypothetical protein
MWQSQQVIRHYGDGGPGEGEVLGNVAGRPKKIIIGDTQSPDYEVGYVYDPYNARLTSITGPGLPPNGAAYTYEPDSDLVSQIDFKSGATTLARTLFFYDDHRDAVTDLRIRWIPSNQVMSRYRHAYDALGRRTHVIRTGPAFGTESSDIWTYNDRNELTVSERFDDVTVPLESNPAAGLAGPPSRGEPFREAIVTALERGLSSQRIWQDPKSEHGFDGGYDSAKRFCQRLKQATATGPPDGERQGYEREERESDSPRGCGRIPPSPFPGTWPPQALGPGLAPRPVTGDDRADDRRRRQYPPLRLARHTVQQAGQRRRPALERNRRRAHPGLASPVAFPERPPDPTPEHPTPRRKRRRKCSCTRR